MFGTATRRPVAPITTTLPSSTRPVIRGRVPRGISPEIPAPNIGQPVVRIQHSRIRAHVAEIRPERPKVSVPLDFVGAVEVLERCVKKRLCGS